MPCRSFLTLLLLAECLGVCAAPPAAWPEYDDARINDGKSYPLFAPHQSGEVVLRPPFAEQLEMIVHFPYENGLELESISATAQYETPQKVLLQIWKNGHWVDVASADKFNFTFTPPLKTGKIRLIFTGVSNRDHDILRYRNFQVKGRPLGPEITGRISLELFCPAENNVFDLPDHSPRLNARLVNASGESRRFRLESEFQYYAGGVAEREPATEVTLAAGESFDVPVQMRGKEPGPYLGVVSVYEDGRLLARKAILTGLRDPAVAEGRKLPDKFISPETRRPRPDWRSRLRQDGTLWSVDATHCLGGRNIPDENFFAKTGADGAELAMAIGAYHQFEPLPGVYNFQWSDRMVERAGRHGVGLEFGLWLWDFDGPSQFWLKDELRRGPDGTPGKRWQGIPSLFSTKYTRHALRAVELMAARYADCPEVRLWSPHPYGMVDHDTTGIYDTHPEALAAFRDMLRRKYGEIGKLNRAYGTGYSGFSDVPAPESLADQKKRAGNFAEAATLVDMRPEWHDYLDFYHRRVVEFRNMAAEAVRKHDRTAGISGMNASGGVGDADGQYRSLVAHGGFYGDQGLNIKHYFRRYIGQRRYRLPLRHEDIAAVKIGRAVTAETMPGRCNWNVFQAAMLGVDHFNFVFSCWDDNAFYDTVFANRRIQKLIKDANRMEGCFVPLGYHHSFLSDAYTGCYSYMGISVYRWWLMNAAYTAMLENGAVWEAFADNADLAALAGMKLIFDDGSSLVTPEFTDALAAFVKAGGKAVLSARTGTFQKGEFKESDTLLRKFGYSAPLSNPVRSNTELSFEKGNGIFSSAKRLTINNYTPLSVPVGGRVLGTLSDGSPGAVAWKFGEGEVLLLAGNPGANREIDLLQAEAEKRKNEIWRNAEEDLCRELQPVLQDLQQWAQIHEEYRLNVNCYSALRKRDKEQLLLIFNQKETEQHLTVSFPRALSPSICTAVTLENEIALGKFEKEALRTGVRLPSIPAGSFMALYIRTE